MCFKKGNVINDFYGAEIQIEKKRLDLIPRTNNYVRAKEKIGAGKMMLKRTESNIIDNSDEGGNN